MFNKTNRKIIKFNVFSFFDLKSTKVEKHENAQLEMKTKILDWNRKLSKIVNFNFNITSIEDVSDKCFAEKGKEQVGFDNHLFKST